MVGFVLGFVTSSAVFYLGGLGGADVKLIAAVGAVVGPIRCCACSSGPRLQAACSHLRPSLLERESSPYVPAIAAGLLIQTFWPEGLRIVLLR